MNLQQVDEGYQTSEHGARQTTQSMLIGDYFPLIVQVQPMLYTEAVVRQMAEEYEVYFARGERYAVLTVQPQNAARPSAKERKLIANWVNSPRVMQFAGKLCVGSSNVVTANFDRGLLTALLWFWRPPFPLKAFGDLDSALDYAIERLDEAKLPLRPSASQVRRLITQRVSNYL